MRESLDTTDGVDAGRLAYLPVSLFGSVMACAAWRSLGGSRRPSSACPRGSARRSA